MLSSSPDDPQLERWLQRQATAEGERLDDLRRRFWDGAHWQRHDRVLVLEARSLLWALDPLAATPEGGVVITVGQPSDLERLQAQLQVLDALRQPQLLVVQADAPASLRSQLEPGEGSRFDWAVARQPWRGLNAQQIDTWIAAVGAQMSANGQWRLLFSTPQLGPAAGLQALSRAAEPALQPLLEELSALERQQLQQEPNPGQLARQALIDQGWRVEQQHWQEALQLELSTVLLARWLAPESTYLQQLNAMRGAP
ncbi:hypothetical protein AAF143_09110 [Cyanobium sp. ATX-6F1]